MYVLKTCTTTKTTELPSFFYKALFSLMAKINMKLLVSYIKLYYELNSVPLNSYGEALTPRISDETLFGHVAFEGVIKLK